MRAGTNAGMFGGIKKSLKLNEPLRLLKRRRMNVLDNKLTYTFKNIIQLVVR
jgi:hypothetical protein